MNTQLVNEIRLIYRQLCIVQEQYAKAKDMVAGLRKLHTGSSNEPVFEDLPQLDFMLRHSADNSKVSSHEFAATHSRRKVSGGK